MKNISVTLAIAASLLAFSCQNNTAGSENDDAAAAADTAHSGLEGTRDQAATVTGSEVVQDTTAGQSAGKEQSGAQSASTDSAAAETGKPR